MCATVIRAQTSRLSQKSTAFDSSPGQKAIEVKLVRADCGAASGHLMNHKKRTAERKKA